MRTSSFVFAILITLIASCNRGVQEQKLPEDVFGDFRIVLGESPGDKTQVFAFFWEKNVGDEMLAISEDLKVYMDTFLVTFDSTWNPIYSVALDTSVFHGKHAWKLSLKNKIIASYPLTIKPLKLLSEIPKMVGKAPVEIRCNALETTDVVRMVISGELAPNSESSFNITAGNGAFTIPAEIWKRVNGKNLRMQFDLSTFTKIHKDSVLTQGGIMESRRVTRNYEITLER